MVHFADMLEQPCLEPSINFAARAFGREAWHLRLLTTSPSFQAYLFEVAIGGFTIIIDIFFLVNLNFGSYILGFLIFSGSVERHVKLHSLQIYISHSLPTGD
jgi:hypothetical protein